MNLKNIPNGAYDENLNKVKMNFCHIDSVIDTLEFMVHNGQRFELKRDKNRGGSVVVSDVTDAGTRGTGSTIRFHDQDDRNRDDLKVCNNMNWEYDSIASFVNAFNDLVDGASDGEVIDLQIGEEMMKATVSFFKTERVFSILGTYKPLNGRPKKWTNWLVIRGLVNFQLQRTASYIFDRYTDDDDFLKQRDPLSQNLYLAKDLYRFPSATSRWSGNNKDTTNNVGVRFHSNDFYTLEIIDPKMMAKKNFGEALERGLFIDLVDRYSNSDYVGGRPSQR